MANRNLQVFDGVAFMQRGDVALYVYSRDARLHRTRWAFDRADESVRSAPDGPDTPDRATLEADLRSLWEALAQEERKEKAARAS